MGHGHPPRPTALPAAARSLVADYSGVATRYGEVSAAALPTLAARNFPLCMSHLVTALHSERHLRHGGRQQLGLFLKGGRHQLGLFLKGIGLPMEEALLFWRAEFSPKTTSEAFDKQYAYNIRHSYGREGKRTDYTAHKTGTAAAAPAAAAATAAR
ncbi:putative DNA primase large subunit [Tetrabaena socialis]|uniref:Putative DNA primase large subunit n=1 Tax=Tetrabaena socialis TaxID=47790 RepID=A0A2J7ZZH3_9CHLO|nr:putative DNA primase large subunit [Tetrabaena socialis]|eukprot:PNH05665.1 putative DNA primase large subunit [Tetrabaena socialis]